MTERIQLISSDVQDSAITTFTQGEERPLPSFRRERSKVRAFKVLVESDEHVKAQVVQVSTDIQTYFDYGLGSGDCCGSESNSNNSAEGSHAKNGEKFCRCLSYTPIENGKCTRCKRTYYRYIV